MRVSLDLELASDRVVGPRSGLPVGHPGAMAAALGAVHARVEEAASAGLLPHLALGRDPAAVAAWVERGRALRGRGTRGPDRLVLVGEPGAVAALRALAPRAPGLRVIDRCDPVGAAAALEGARRPVLLVLAGPAWVEAWAGEVAPPGAAVLVLGDPDEGGGGRRAGVERVDAPLVADPRFGAVLGGALLVAGWAGAEPAALALAAEQAAGACTRRAIHENPAYRLGAAASWLAVARQRSQPVLVVPAADLDPWAAWASRAWAAFSSRATPAVAGEALRGAAPLALPVGDEALLQRVTGGPQDTWIAALHLRSEGPPGGLAARLLAAQVDHLVGAGCPVARLSLRGTAPADLLALSWVWVHGALVAAALDPVDPLTMDAADRWRAAADAAVLGEAASPGADASRPVAG